MHIQKLSQNPSEISYTGRKIPRYLYHLTSKKAYNSMLSDGFLKMGKDDFFGQGVFSFELSNFFKRWRTSRDWGNASLMNKLINRISIFNKSAVILKIPTAKINTDELVVRSQNKVLSIFHNDKLPAFSDMQLFLSQKRAAGMDEGEASVLAAKKFFPNFMPHFTSGVPAKYSKILKQRKQALEYIYPHHISMDIVQKIGEADLEALVHSKNYNLAKPMHSIFSKLLEGTPEAKAAEFLDC